jgi:hypothetical protein
LPELVPKGSQYFIFGFRKLREGKSRGNGHCYFGLQYSPTSGMRVNTTPACENSLLTRLRLPAARRRRPFSLFDILLVRLQAKLRPDRKIEEGPVSVKDFTDHLSPDSAKATAEKSANTSRQDHSPLTSDGSLQCAPESP